MVKLPIVSLNDSYSSGTPPAKKGLKPLQVHTIKVLMASSSLMTSPTGTLSPTLRPG